jgi:hypothetical protein
LMTPAASSQKPDASVRGDAASLKKLYVPN